MARVVWACHDGMKQNELADRNCGKVIDDREIWACAHQILRQYGDVAWFHAAQRADDLLAAEDCAGHRTWLRILRCIEALDKLEPEGSLQ